jgi:hypothetical protein
LAAAAAAALAAGGALLPAGGVARWVLVLGSALAAADGVVSRVAAVALSCDALGVERAVARNQAARWTDVRELRPPRTPAGRWRVLSTTGGISLMPSDLFGAESVLGEVVRRSSLEFRLGRWRRAAGARDRRDTAGPTGGPPGRCPD